MAVSLLGADVKTIVGKLCKSHEAPHFHMPKCQLSILNFHTTFPFILGTWDLTIATTIIELVILEQAKQLNVELECHLGVQHVMHITHLL
jgi:hypothetical protein